MGNSSSELPWSPLSSYEPALQGEHLSFLFFLFFWVLSSASVLLQRIQLLQ
uniref:Uncharacterized protein n=1 Tax=Anguilla anguilla TaxID=7936 RepID=A0A0E9P6A2_ANGAN